MFSVIMVIVAFAAGIFGAALGALGVFIMMGFIIIAGVLGGSDFAVGNIAFGLFFGPHVSFAAGCAAAAFAGRRKSIGAGNDIATPLIKTNDYQVLLVGGIFGIIGYLIQTSVAMSGFLIDSVAITVVVSNIIVRLLLGKSGLIGDRSAEAKRKFVPDLKSMVYLLVQSFGISAIVAYMVTLEPGFAVLGFGISAASLITAHMGFAMPVTHHVTLIAGLATATSGNLWIGIACGIVAAFIGEFHGRTFNTAVDSHFDSPAVAIATMSLVVNYLL